MLQTLASICTRLLAAYPTLLSDDEKMLAPPQLPLNYRLALSLRVGEKRLLRHWLSLAEDVAAVVTQAPAGFCKEYLSAVAAKSPVHAAYVEHTWTRWL